MPTTLVLRAALIASLTALGACDGYNDVVASLQLAQSPEQADDQADQVDGTYKGIVTVEQSQGAGCPSGQVGTVEVGDHTLFFAYSPSVFFISFVQPDGTVAGEAGDTKLSGKLEDGRLNFTVTSPVCTVSYDFRYVV